MAACLSNRQPKRNWTSVMRRLNVASIHYFPSSLFRMTFGNLKKGQPLSCKHALAANWFNIIFGQDAGEITTTLTYLLPAFFLDIIEFICSPFCCSTTTKFFFMFFRVDDHLRWILTKQRFFSCFKNNLAKCECRADYLLARVWHAGGNKAWVIESQTRLSHWCA